MPKGSWEVFQIIFHHCYFFSNVDMRWMLESVFTWNFIRGWKNPCLWVNVSYCLHVFAEMIFHPGMTKRKKTYEHFIPGLNFAMSMLLLDFWRMCSIYFPTLTYLNVMKVKRNTCGLFIKREARKIIYFLCKV